MDFGIDIDLNAVLDDNYNNMTKEELINVVKQRDQEIRRMSLQIFNETMPAPPQAPPKPEPQPKHAGGRPKTYDQQLIRDIIDYKREGHTYRDTASRFGVSVNTVQRYCEG